MMHVRKRWLLSSVVLVLGMMQGRSVSAQQAVSEPPPPPLAGSYVPAPAGHPFVFTTRQKMSALLAAHTPITTAALAQLQKLAVQKIAQQARFAQAYSGCDVGQYTVRFAEGGASADDAISKLATYAYLASLNEGYGRAELQQQAVAAAKNIMLSWVRAGFQINGSFATDPHAFCSGDLAGNRIANILVGLLIGRAMPAWVNAQDLLEAVNAFTPQETAELNRFLVLANQLLQEAAREKSEHDAPRECDRFNNQTISGLIGMIAIARLQDNGPALTAAARGGAGVALPWTAQVQGSIFGNNDRRRTCGYGPAGVRSLYYYELPTVAPGEIVDRYRAEPFQTFGYPLGALGNMLLTASILHDSGFDSLDYKGNLGQSPLLALQYYSYYFANFLSTSQAVVPAQPSSYPDYLQYVGHPVSRDHGVTVEALDGALDPFVVGYALYPSDQKIQAVLKRALNLGGGSVVPFADIDTMLIAYLPALDQLQTAH